ncbi:hypothetical protein ACFY05_39205 [Microtetraspora fusca]|uniref:Uncharacterized protein n=1 Tax=Microtetraspora fusca TaxID=1997 RepID=A0ABW6VHR2_MICFU
MHEPIAAGIGIELAAEGDDWTLKSKVGRIVEVGRDSRTRLDPHVA